MSTLARGSRSCRRRRSLLFPPGSRSRCLDGCSRQRTAFPLHLSSPCRKEIVLPHQCKRCILPPRATVSSGSTEKPSSGSHQYLHHKRRESKKTERGENVKNKEQGCCFTVLFLIQVLTQPLANTVLRFGVTGAGLPTMREAKIDRAPVRLCLCNSSSLSLVRSGLGCASPTCLTVKAIRATVAAFTLHLWNYGNSSLLKKESESR